MHEYKHRDKDDFKTCVDCGKSFPFEGQLKVYRKSHLTALEHQCSKCNKCFKNKGDAVKHQAVHSGNIWKCDKCDYKCKDPRNLKAHKHTHGDKTRYCCPKCNHGFNHYIQWKHHKSLPACKKQCKNNPFMFYNVWLFLLLVITFWKYHYPTEESLL